VECVAEHIMYCKKKGRKRQRNQNIYISKELWAKIILIGQFNIDKFEDSSCGFTFVKVWDFKQHLKVKFDKRPRMRYHHNAKNKVQGSKVSKVTK
jgi:hypothetical protein